MNIFVSMWNRIKGFFSWLAQGIRNLLGMGGSNQALDSTEAYTLESRTLEPAEVETVNKQTLEDLQKKRQGCVDALKNIQELGKLLFSGDATISIELPWHDYRDEVDKYYEDANSETQDKVLELLGEIRKVAPTVGPSGERHASEYDYIHYVPDMKGNITVQLAEFNKSIERLNESRAILPTEVPEDSMIVDDMNDSVNSLTAEIERLIGMCDPTLLTKQSSKSEFENHLFPKGRVPPSDEAVGLASKILEDKYNQLDDKLMVDEMLDSIHVAVTRLPNKEEFRGIKHQAVSVANIANITKLYADLNQVSDKLNEKADPGNGLG